jgi:hypothetical protein
VREFVDNFKTYEVGSPEYYTAMVRAHVGTAAWGALAAIVALGVKGFRDDDEEPIIRFIGPGHPDPRVRRARREAGVEKPFHVRVGNDPRTAIWLPYKDWPALFLPLSIAGSVSDRLMTKDILDTEVEDIWAHAFLSGIAVTLDRNMVSGLSTFLKLIADPSLSDEERTSELNKALRGKVSPYANPGMVKVAENLVTGQRYDSRSFKGTALASIPFGQAIAGEPAFNVLGQPIKVPWEDVVFGRFFSATHFDPVLGPLAAAGLTVPPPRREHVSDDGVNIRKPTPEETRMFNLFYGQEMTERLTEAEVARLVERASEGNRGKLFAEERLSRLGTSAANRAWRRMREEQDVRKGNRRRAILRGGD